MRFLTRKRQIAAGVVLLFVAALVGIGAISRNTSDTETTTPTVAVSPATTPVVPTENWYWTMAVSPSNPNVLVVGTSAGLERSTNGGKTWKPSGPKNVNTTSVVVAGKVLYAGGTPMSAEASPVIRTGATRSAPKGKGLLERSADGGQTWKTLHPGGLPNETIQALAAAPGSATTLYALLADGKLYRSTNAGGSFALVTSKVGIPPWSLAITDSGYVSGDMDTGQYLSGNGKSWQHTSFENTLGNKMVMEYAVQPGDPSHVLMTAYGVESSTDGGKSWSGVLNSNTSPPTMFGPVAWSESQPGTAYAIGFDGSLWRSTDGGKTWTAVT